MVDIHGALFARATTEVGVRLKRQFPAATDRQVKGVAAKTVGSAYLLAYRVLEAMQPESFQSPFVRNEKLSEETRIHAAEYEKRINQRLWQHRVAQLANVFARCGVSIETSLAIVQSDFIGWP